MDGVLRRANATEYGLASGVFTQDIGKALYVSEKLEAGTVFVNTYNKTDVAAPFGGCKQSGFGKDLGKYLKAVIEDGSLNIFGVLNDTSGVLQVKKP